MKSLVGLFLFLAFTAANAQQSKFNSKNLDHFSERKRNLSSEIKKLIPEDMQWHPEVGILPFNSPNSDCIELVDRRTSDSRYFVKPGTNGSQFFIQQASGPINYQSEGWWKEINYRLEKKSDGVFVASHQPIPVAIDLKSGKISLTNLGFDLSAKNPVLIWREDNGTEHFLGEANYSNYTAGDEGVRVKNIYPGIDLVYVVRQGEIESGFILNKKLPYKSGEIILRQELNLPADFRLSPEKTAGKAEQSIYVSNKENVPYFTVERGFAFDNSSSAIPLTAFVSDKNTFEFSVPVKWLADPSTVYPVLIDPVLTTSGNVPVAGIAGTKYSAVCWSNSCDYTLAVPTPANCTIDSILQSFEFYTTGACVSQDGGYSIDFLGCHAPAAAPGVFTVPAIAYNIPNFFFTITNAPIPEFISCLPPPQCASQNFNFTLHFFRCNHDLDPTCAGNCVRATQPWIMTIQGRTLEVNTMTPAQTVCEGTTANIIVSPVNGVPPYSFAWSPIAGLDDTLSVTATATTVFSVTVTDACGTTATGTSNLTVTPDNNPGFTITPNPACVNDVVTLSGNGAGPAANYDWTVPGGNAPGNVINDTQSPTVSYSVAGSFPVVLSYPGGTCQFKDTTYITITGSVAATVAITAQPAGTICAGDTIRFHANPVNGGPAPTYDWFIDGANVQSGTSDSLVSNAFINGSHVEAILHSNGSCTSPSVDTASLFVSIGNAMSPQVTITPDTAVCPGSPVTLNANATGGGSTPAFQWFANGNPIAGQTASSYSFTATAPDTNISVQMTSSLSCVTASSAGDTSVVSILQNVQPFVSINASPAGTVCSGDSVIFTASPANGGGAPVFQWFVNGVASAVTDSVLRFLPVNGDSISVQLTSSLTCVVANTDDDYQVMSVSPAVSPTVNLSVSPSSTFCLGDNVVFNAQALSAGSNPVYTWTVNGNSVVANDSVYTTSTLNNNDQVQVIVTSSLSCAPVVSDTGLITVSVLNNVAPTATISASSSSVCEGSPVQLITTTNNAGNAPAVEWFVNGVSTGQFSDTIVMTTLHQGDTVEAHVTTSLGCVTTPVTISSPYYSTLLPHVLPEINILSTPPDTICVGQDVQFSADVLNGGSSPTISWYLNNLPAITAPTFSSSTLQQGEIVQATITSNAPCLIQPNANSNFIRILSHPPLTVQLNVGLPACPGVPALIIAQPSGGTGGPYQYTWGDGTTGTDSLILPGGPDMHVFVQVEDNCTASPATSSILVPVLPGPVADFSYVNPAPGSFENNIQFINQSSSADSYTWIFPDSTISTDENPLHHFADQGTFEVMLVTVNNNGCIDTVSYNVSVLEEIAVYYPNSFSPNGDGKNENFQPIGASLEEYELTIWNRWGEKIYQGDSHMSWDGRIRNTSKIAPEGVYIFRLDLMETKAEKRVVTGRVTLIR